MATNDSRGFRTPARTNASATNRRVTARVVREDDGSQRTIYAVDGDDIGSLEALRTALGEHR